MWCVIAVPYKETISVEQPLELEYAVRHPASPFAWSGNQMLVLCGAVRCVTSLPITEGAYV